MLPEQQQRIMGYFIEEAKDHLNTIEQGLLSLQATIEDSEKANELFRAAHSVKGGAAMLGLESIQKTAHRMEDYFKILKESSVKVDRMLETMFLRVSDGLKDLLEQLEGPFGLTPDKAQEIMADVEPVFDQLAAHLNELVAQSGSTAAATANSSDSGSFTPEAVQARFKRDVAGLLREMLATFKQPDNAETRKKLQDSCTQLIAIGEQFELAAWCDLIETARLAADSPSNDYRALAPVLIKEIKKAQDLVLSGRASEVAVCDALQALLPEDILATETEDLSDLDLDYELADSLSDLDLKKVEDSSTLDSNVEEASEEEVGLESLFEKDVEPMATGTAVPSEAEEDFEGLFGEGRAVDEAEESDAIADDSVLEGSATETDEDNLGENELFETAELFEAGLDGGNETEAPIGRLSVDLDFDEIPSELSALNRNAESEEKADESLDALLATVNVTGPDVGTEELNSLADLFDGDLDELDNTLGGHAFISEEMQLNPEKIDLSPEDDLGDLLTGEATEDAFVAGESMDDMDDDLFGGTLTDGEFVVALDSDLSEPNEIESDDISAETESSEVAPAQTSADISDLSGDPWADDADDDLFGIGDDALSFELSETNDSEVDNSNLENSSLDDSALGISDLDDPALDLPELDIPALDDSALESTIDDFDLDALNLDSSETAELETAELGDVERQANESFTLTTEQAVEHSQISSHTVSPRELDIEFPTLTGVKLEKAEEAIDSFFLDDPDEASVNGDEALDDGFLFDVDSDISGVDDELSEAFSAEASSQSGSLDVGNQLADDPWGELPIEATLTGVEGSDVAVEQSNDVVVEPSSEIAELDWDDELEQDGSSFDASEEVSGDADLAADFLEAMPATPVETSLDVEQASSELDELLGSSADDESNSASLSTESDTDELWDELVSSPETVASLDAERQDSAEENVDNQTDGLTTVHHDVSGDELSDEILADFATAFGIETAGADLLEEVANEEDAAEQNEFNDVWSEESSEDLSQADAVENPEVGTALEDLPTLDGVARELEGEDFEDSLSPLSVAAEDVDSSDADSSDADSSDADGFSAEGLDDIDSLFEADSAETETDVAVQEVAPVERVAESSEADDFFEGEAFSLDELDGFLTEDELEALEEDELPQQMSEKEDDSSAAFDGAFSLETNEDDSEEDFDDLDSLLTEGSDIDDDFDSLLADDSGTDSDFGDLDSLLADDVAEEPSRAVGNMPTFVGDEDTLRASASDEDEDFGDLERLLEDGPGSVVPAAQKKVAQRSTARRSGGGSGGLRDQNMRVSVSHLDTLSNLVGELVVSRNTLERDQERLRQFLDNLLFQVQQLNDVGQRMRDLYERSLLESSLMSNRMAHSAQSGQTADAADDNHETGEIFDALEMDRFTGFHTLSQEMIELIVRVRESSSDIGYTVESSDQVTRQFRQITTQLQEGLNTARMVAFSQAADRLPRAVRDISLKCGKEARLVVEGQDTLIDKMLVEHLYDPLTHLVNNAITHGIETPEDRKAAGKSSEGAITVRAFYQGNQTVIYVADDGGGINTEFVKRKAIEKKLITQAEAAGLSDIETYDLLFHAGFSTRDQADDFAGRGVGMDVVRTSLAEIRGSVTIDSEMGRGTSFTIRLPLTLSISKALSCVSNQARIAFPMDGVEDMLDVPRDRIVQNEQGQDCVRWRDKLLTFQPVTELLKFNRTLGRGRVYGGGQDDDVLSIIVLRSANTYIAVQVDQVIGEQEIVIKQLEGPVPKPLGIAGATILGDGRVMPIADVLELIDIATGRVRRESSTMLWAQDVAQVTEESSAKQDPTVLIVDDSITVRELLSMSFNKVGYRVEQARDGQEAWDKLRSGLPCDLVFCDIEMPRMDGLELLSRMQKDNHLKRIPIAMLTSRGADRHRQMAVDLGASGYFTKPYLEEALLDAAQRMLNGETLAKGRGG